MRIIIFFGGLMKKMKHKLFYLIVSCLLLLSLFFIPGFSFPIIQSSQNTKEKSISKLIKVKIGDTEQWLLIRSENIKNPIILIIHGGPGTSEMTLNRRYGRELEKHFTVVNWDQRGACKSYHAGDDLSKMTVDQIVSDAIEVSEYLKTSFKQQKIFLLGHSWGSTIGILTVQKRPDLYYAYIGVGQMAYMKKGEEISYNWTLEKAIAKNDNKSEKLLRQMGTPPYKSDWKKNFMTQRKILGSYGGEMYQSRIGAFGVVISSLILSTEYTIIDKINFFRGIFRSVEILLPQIYHLNLFSKANDLKIPIFFLLGTHDFEVPYTLSIDYFNKIKCPYKRLILFHNSAHLPNVEENHHFNKQVILIKQEILKNQY